MLSRAGLWWLVVGWSAWAADPQQAAKPTEASMIETAAKKVLADASPDRGPLAVFLQTGAGERAAAAAARLRGLLTGPRVIFSKVELKPAGPLPDADRPGEHVNQTVAVWSPPPQLVVSVSQSDGVLFIAARPPGRDALGPAENGWAWVLSSPR